MIEQVLKQYYDEAVDAMQKNSSKKVMQVISQAYSDTANNLQLFYDFVAHVFLIDPLFFNEKVLNKYVKSIKKILNINKVLELESYILQNHCFYQDEQLVAMSPGEIIIKNGKNVGRLYITNFRMFCIGELKTKGTTFVTVSPLQKAIMKSATKSLLRNLQLRLGKIAGEALPYIGTQYPMFGIEKIKPSGRSLKYTCRIPNEAGITKRYKFHVKASGADAPNFIGIVVKTIEEANKAFSES